MKYLLLFVVLAVAYLLWRQGRLAGKSDPPAASGQPAARLQDMVSCAACELHLPRGDALSGPDGRLYCSPEHRLLGSRGLKR